MPLSTPRRLPGLAASAALVLTLGGVAACGSSSSSTTTSAPATTAPATTTTAAAPAVTLAGAAAGAPVVTGAWARPSPAMTTAGAAYMTITSATGDELLGVTAPTAVAGTVEIHETVPASSASGGHAMPGDPEATHGGASGMASTTSTAGMPSTTSAGGQGGMGAMVMQPVASVALPAGQAVELKPGGLHIMLLDLPQPLTAGQTIPLTLRFATAGEVTVEVPVEQR